MKGSGTQKERGKLEKNVVKGSAAQKERGTGTSSHSEAETSSSDDADSRDLMLLLTAVIPCVGMMAIVAMCIYLYAYKGSGQANTPESIHVSVDVKPAISMTEVGECPIFVTSPNGATMLATRTESKVYE